MWQAVRRSLHPVWRRAPRLRSLALAAVDVAVRPLFLPFRLGRPPSQDTRARLEAQTDKLNAAAERYFAAHTDERHLLDKPFSEPAALSRRLIDVGVLIDGLRLEPGDTVLELGAGSCWLSHFLNRFGCRTISIDVSPSALAVGRRLFERDPHTNWSLDPQFLAYDGRALPVGDGSVDRVLLYDAYHHLPNPAQLLREMRRALRPDGIVAMSEPGRGHAETGVALSEAATGVLENELVIEDIGELALASGFTAARIIVAANAPLAEIDVAGLRPFMGGRGFAQYWKNLCAALDGHHYLLLFCGDPAPTTRRARRLKAILRITPAPVQASAGQPAAIEIELHNAGDTRWLSTANQPGWTRVGAHLYRADPSRTLVDFDWLRVELPRDIAPNQTVRVRATLPPITDPGDYLAAFDLVIEGKAWFADRDSVSIDLPLSVR
jgi:SAM-dependent methyltransferase